MTATTIAPADFERADRFEDRITYWLDTLRAKREARRILAAEEGGTVALPEFLTLRERLARPRQHTEWLIEHWQPKGTRAMLTAQFKAGKTTVKDNWTRSLLDGDPFLGSHAVTPIAGTVVDFDFELSESMMDDWKQQQGIRNDDRLVPIPMRGRASTFDILDAARRTEWARRLQALGAEYVVLDCLRPILDALGLEEHRDAGRFLVAFDALLAEASIPSALVVHHMGHLNERARGDLRLRDWPDVEVRLVRQDDNPASQRFIAAYGRDVDVAESALEYNPATRRLTVSIGSRKDAEAAAGLEDVRAVLAATDDWLSQRGIEQACDEAGSAHSRAIIRAAVKLGIRAQTIATKRGPRRAILHQCASAPECAVKTPAHCSLECASAPPLIREAHSTHSDFSFDGDAFGFSAPQDGLKR